MFFDPFYLILVMLPCGALAAFATWKTKSTFSKFARVRAASGITGAQAAQTLLQRNGVDNVKIEMVQGFLSDHYDPRHRTLRLSPDVYQTPSLAAVGVACHEAGHALQHANGYAPLQLRSLLVPATSISSKMSMPVLFGGFILSGSQIGSGSSIGTTLLMAGIALFAMTVIFSIITLPVEWDATARAKRLMVSSGIVSPAEAADAGKVLNAAFLTYLASAISALLTLIYYLWRSGLLGGRR